MIDVRIAIVIIVLAIVCSAIISHVCQRLLHNKLIGRLEITGEGDEKIMHLTSPIPPDELLRQKTVTFAVVDHTHK